MTSEGETLLKEELQRLKFEERPSVIDAIATAREFGDLKENAEYHAAKEQQSYNEGRIEEINDIIARANVIDITKMTNEGKVIFGATVYLTNLDTGEKINYKIVGKDEADLKKKLIFSQSPIGKGLIGKNKNDLIVVDKSAEAKAIKIGMSYQSAISMHGDVIVIKGDYVMYGEVHQKNMLSLNHISPKIECGGLGMVFVDITGLEMLYKNMDNLKQKILSSIPQEFNPRVGIADNKFFSYIAALESAPNQCMDYIDSVEFRSKIGVDILPIASTNKAKLKELGINNLTQIADWNINLLQIQFGIKEGKKILDNSGLKLISAENLDDAAKKIVEAIK